MNHSYPADRQMNMGKLAGATLIVAMVVTTASPAAAQTPVDRSVSTSATGRVTISNVAGEVRVVGWDRQEVQVSGTLGEGTERLDVTSDGDDVSVEVVIPRDSRNVRGSELEVRVPVRKDVTVRGVSSGVNVAGVTGNVDARSTSGAVQVRGTPALVVANSTSGDVDIQVTAGVVKAHSTSGSVRVAGTARESIAAESVSGAVQVSAPAPELVAKSVSGQVEVSAPVRRISASTVSGTVDVAGGALQYGSFETVSGNVTFGGRIEADGALNVQSHSGSVTLQLAAPVAARFEVSTFSGDIRNAFGPEAQRTSRYTPGQELSFTSGDGGALVTIKTFSGGVRLERR